MPRKTGTMNKKPPKESALSKERWTKLSKDSLLGVDYCLRLLSTSVRMQKPQMEIIRDIHTELWEHIDRRFPGDGK